MTKVSDYPNERVTEPNDDDLLDMTIETSPGVFQSQKMKWSVLKSILGTITPFTVPRADNSGNLVDSGMTESEPGISILSDGLGIGIEANSLYSLYIKGETSDDTKSALVIDDSTGSNILWLENDGFFYLKNGTGVNNISTDGTLSANSENNLVVEKAMKTYVDSLTLGLLWQNPVQFVNCIGTATTPQTGVDTYGYIINTGGATGDWSAFSEGDLVQYQTSEWVLVKSLEVGDRIGVSMVSMVTSVGDFAGKEDSIMTISGGSAGAWTYSEETPVNQWAIFVNNANAYYNNIAYTYSDDLTQWVQFAGSVNLEFGDSFTVIGSVVSIAPNAISYDEMQKVAADQRLWGNISGVSQDVAELTPTQVRTMLNVEDGAEPTGWHGSTTTIKIAAWDIVSYDDKDGAAIENNGGLITDAGGKITEMVAKVHIPSGYKATAYQIYASSAIDVEIFENQIDDSTSVPKGSGSANTEVDMTDVNFSTTNYLSIIMVEAGSNIYGGYVTIAAI